MFLSLAYHHDCISRMIFLGFAIRPITPPLLYNPDIPFLSIVSSVLLATWSMIVWYTGTRTSLTTCTTPLVARLLADVMGLQFAVITCEK